MRHAVLFLAATLALAACADGTPVAPTAHPAVRPNAFLGCMPGEAVPTFGPVQGIPDGPIAVGAPLAISTTIADAGTATQAVVTWDSDRGIEQTVNIVDGVVRAEYAYPNAGTYTIYVLVGCAWTSATVSVVEGAPAPGAPAAEVPPTSGAYALPPDPVAIGTPVTVTATFQGGTTTTAIVTWGDGTADTVAVVNGAVTATHAYPTTGLYPVTVTSGGLSATPTAATYVPVYDPAGGFVTGGGWIASPAGAYRADPSLTGKSTFGFVAKAKPGRVTPDGNTEFQFHGTRFNFKSRSYEWLVVAGSKAMYRGEGTVNGAGRYGFQVTVVDGRREGTKVDRFRMRIWDAATGAVVYDNELGATDDATPTTALSGGSIVIHAK